MSRISLMTLTLFSLYYCIYDLISLFDCASFASFLFSAIADYFYLPKSTIFTRPWRAGTRNHHDNHNFESYFFQYPSAVTMNWNGLVAFELLEERFGNADDRTTKASSIITNYNTLMLFLPILNKRVLNNRS